MFKLAVKSLDQLLIVCEVLLGEFKFLPRDLLPLLCLSQLLPQVPILGQLFLLLFQFAFVLVLCDDLLHESHHLVHSDKFGQLKDLLDLVGVHLRSPAFS